MIECFGICSENCTAWQNGKCVLDAKKAEVIYDFETQKESAEEQQCCHTKGNVMDLLNDVLYHLSCPSCGADWWDSNAFPSFCPYCNTNRIPKRTDKKDEE